jgi:hypothetical protein
MIRREKRDKKHIFMTMRKKKIVQCFFYLNNVYLKYKCLKNKKKSFYVQEREREKWNEHNVFLVFRMNEDREKRNLIFFLIELRDYEKNLI